MYSVDYLTTKCQPLDPKLPNIQSKYPLLSSVIMATEMNQSCVDCSISYLGNVSQCINESTYSCCTVTRKSPKWHQRLLKRDSRSMSRSYLCLDILDDCEYPFNITESSLGSDLTGSDWSLSSSTTLHSETSSNATINSETSSNATTDSDYSQEKSHKLHTIITRKLKNPKKQAKVVPL